MVISCLGYGASGTVLWIPRLLTPSRARYLLSTGLIPQKDNCKWLTILLFSSSSRTQSSFTQMVSCPDSRRPSGEREERRTVWHLHKALASASLQSWTGPEQVQFRRLYPGAPLANSSVVLKAREGSVVGAELVVRVIGVRRKSNHRGQGNKAEQTVFGGIAMVIKPLHLHQDEKLSVGRRLTLQTEKKNHVRCLPAVRSRWRRSYQHKTIICCNLFLKWLKVFFCCLFKNAP